MRRNLGKRNLCLTPGVLNRRRDRPAGRVDDVEPRLPPAAEDRASLRGSLGGGARGVVAGPSAVKGGDSPSRKPGLSLGPPRGDEGRIGAYNTAMAKRPKHQRSIKRGRICDGPDGVGTPDEVAARVTYTGHPIHKSYPSPAGPRCAPMRPSATFTTQRTGRDCWRRSARRSAPAASGSSVALSPAVRGYGSTASCMRPD